MGKNYMGIALASQPIYVVSIIQCPCQSEFGNSKMGHRRYQNNDKNLPKLKKRLMRKNRLSPLTVIGKDGIVCFHIV